MIASVEADARHPLAPGDHGTLIDCEEDEIEMAMLGMAQEIELLKAELGDALSFALCDGPTLNERYGRYLELCESAGVKP